MFSMTCLFRLWFKQLRSGIVSRVIHRLGEQYDIRFEHSY